MPERRFETTYWSDPFVMKLPTKAKLLYVYLWTNIHCNQAGLYEIAPETISFETGLALEEVSELMHLLGPKVTWHPEQNLVWVKNFLRRQTRSPLFLIAAAKCLKTINNNGLIREFLDYNQKYNLSIPYQYPINRVSVSDSDTPSPSYSHTGSNTDKAVGVVKGGIETGEAIPSSKSENGENLSEGDREVISTWRSVKGFNMNTSDASELVARMRTEFTGVDILPESKKWAARKLSEPLTKKSRPSQQLWAWMEKAREFAQERSAHESKGQRVKGARPASDFTGKW